MLAGSRVRSGQTLKADTGGDCPVRSDERIQRPVTRALRALPANLSASAHQKNDRDRDHQKRQPEKRQGEQQSPKVS